MPTIPSRSLSVDTSQEQKQRENQQRSKSTTPDATIIAAVSLAASKVGVIPLNLLEDKPSQQQALVDWRPDSAFSMNSVPEGMTAAEYYYNPEEPSSQSRNTSSSMSDASMLPVNNDPSRAQTAPPKLVNSSTSMMVELEDRTTPSPIAFKEEAYSPARSHSSASSAPISPIPVRPAAKKPDSTNRATSLSTQTNVLITAGHFRPQPQNTRADKALTTGHSAVSAAS
jgi:hypothetical protein